MQLEQQTIEQYKKTFPFETLRETSERTGIQITRIFRLFGGKKMRVSELEAFKNAIDAKKGVTKYTTRYQNLLQELILTFDEKELSFIGDYLERKLENKKFLNECSSHTLLMDQIA